MGAIFVTARIILLKIAPKTITEEVIKKEEETIRVVIEIIAQGMTTTVAVI
jgi:hypothetical protein